MMSEIWLDTKYINMLSFRLRNFKRKQNRWHFSCPFCGDSKNNSTKARGNVYPHKGSLRYHCYNCNIPGIDVGKLVKAVDQSLYSEYLKENLEVKMSGRIKTEVEVFADKMKTPPFVKSSALSKLTKISKYSPNSGVRKWIDSRQIPPEYHYKLFVAPKFKAWTNTVLPGKFEEPITSDGPRLIIPLLNKGGDQMIGYQGRSFAKDAAIRYITIMLTDEVPKLFGMDTVDIRQKIIVVEGPIDSMFLPNALASCGSDITTNLSYVSPDLSQFVIVYDNEPRNKETVDKIKKALNKGLRVCIWPDDLEQKDINDMVLSGHSKEELVDIIDENSYTGISGLLRLAAWKRV